MLRKTINYADLDGNPISEEFCFSLSKSELTMLQVSKAGGMEKYLQKIVDDNDGIGVIRTVRDIIEMSIGERDPDGVRFRKSERYTRDFMDSNAFDVLFMELVTNAESATEFFIGIVPEDMRKGLTEKGDRREYSVREMVAMPQAQFDRIAGTDEMKMDRNQLLAAMQRKNKAA